MKKIYCILVGIFVLFCYVSCEQKSNPVQSDTHIEENTMQLQKGKPIRDKEPPTIDVLEVLNPDGVTNKNSFDTPVLLPDGEPVIIHYEVSDNIGITEVRIEIVRDNNSDNKFPIMFTESLYIEKIAYDGSQKTIDDYFLWDGSVKEAYSYDGKIFDQYATENPDVYLLNFQVNDGINNTQNWVEDNEPDLIIEVWEDSKIFVSPTRPRNEFHVTEIIINTNPPNKKKGRFKLSATIGCSQGGFKGRGHWLQVYDGGIIGSIEKSTGYTNSLYNDDDGDGTATTTSELSVGPGTYRFYTKLIYNSNFSYNPLLNVPDTDESDNSAYAEIVIQ